MGLILTIFIGISLLLIAAMLVIDKYVDKLHEDNIFKQFWRSHIIGIYEK